MKVLTVTNLYPTPAEPWFGSFVKDQVEAIRQLGVSVDVFDFDGRSKRRTYATAARTVRKLVAGGTYDAVHAHYGLTGAVALCQRAAPVITTFHGSDSAQVPWQRRVSWVVARRSTPIFVAAENARRLGLPDATVIAPGVDAELFQPTDRTDARAALGWEQDGIYVLLPGARSNAVKRADRFDGALELVAEQVEDVRGVSLEGYDRASVATVLNAVDVVLMTSDSEGSPVTPKEALAVMTPVVSVPVGDLASLLAGLPGCAVVPRDPRLLADAVLHALTVREPALRDRALEYSHESAAKQVVAVYESVLERQPSRRMHASRAHDVG